MSTARYPQLNVYLCSNPRTSKVITHPFRGDEMTNRAFPSLVADLADLPSDGTWSIGALVLDSREKTVADLKVRGNASGGCIRYTWELDDPLDDPYTVRIWAEQGSHWFEHRTGLRIFRLSGRVTDFEGRPLEAVVQTPLQGVSAVADSEGRYELWLPDRHIPWLMALDEGYGRNTLECWAYDFRPRDDLVLDMRIGQIEVYELHAWQGYCGIKLDFLPMSVGLVNAAMADHGSVERGSISPVLSPETVQVDLDGAPADILALRARDEVLPPPGEGEPCVSRQEYSLQLAPTPSTPRIVRVAVRHELGDLTEQGEAFYLGLHR